MADTRISAFPALTGAQAASDDVLPIVDTSAVQSKKIALSEVPAAIGLTDSTGSSLVGFIQSGTGAVARTAQAKMRDFVSVKDFGAVCDGTTDDYAAMLAAMNSGANEVVLPDGEAIYVSQTVEFSSAVKISGGAIIRHPKNYGALRFSPPLASSISVTSIGANANYPVYSNQLSTPITVSSTTGLARGMVCLLSSDDVYSYGNGVKKAELIRILEIVGTTVYTHGIIEDTYSTTIILTPLSDSSFEIDGPVFECVEDVYSATEPFGYGAALYVVGAVNPRINVSARNGLGAGVSFMSCWHPVATVNAKDLRDKSASNALGYGVIAYGATKYGEFTISAERVRHAYTDGDYGGTPLIQQGVPRRNTAKGFAINCTAAAWDTHAESHDTLFDGCEAYNGNGDADSTGDLKYGFQVRGRNVTLKNTRSRGMSGAYIGFSDSLGQSNVCNIINPDWETNGQGSLFNITTKTSTDTIIVKVIGGRLVGGNPLIGNGAPEIVIDGTRIEEGSTFRLGDNNKITLWNVSRDNSGNISEAIVVGPGTRLDVDNLLVRSITGFIGAGKLIQTGSTAGTATVRLGRVYSDVALTSNPIIVSQETTTLSLVANQVYPRKALKGATGSRPVLYGVADQGTMYFDTTLAASGKPIWWQGSVWVDATGAVV